MSDSLISIFSEIAFVMRNTVGMYFEYWSTKEPNDNKILFAKVASISKRTNISKTKACTLYNVHTDGIFLPQLWLWSRSQAMVASNHQIIRLLEKLKNWIATNGKINVWNIRSNPKYRKHTRNYIKYFSTIYLFNRLTRWIPTVENKRNAWQHIQWLDPKKQKTFSFEILMIMFANQTIL